MFDLAMGLGAIILGGCFVLAAIELTDDTPPEWVWKFRRWWHK